MFNSLKKSYFDIFIFLHSVCTGGHIQGFMITIHRPESCKFISFHTNGHKKKIQICKNQILCTVHIRPIHHPVTESSVWPYQSIAMTLLSDFSLLLQLPCFLSEILNNFCSLRFLSALILWIVSSVFSVPSHFSISKVLHLETIKHSIVE